MLHPLFTRFILLLWALPWPDKVACAWQATWIRGSSHLVTPSPRRSGHVSFPGIDPYQHYIFGGYAEEETDAAKETGLDGSAQYRRFVVNDLWRWSSDAFWQPIEQHGHIPGPRLVAAAATMHTHRKAYLFAGWDPQTEGTGGVILNDVHELDLITHQWRSLDCAFPDGPTSRLFAVALADVILLHNHRCHDFVYVFDPAAASFRKQPTNGPCPSPRGLHEAVLLDDGSTIIVTGGAAQDGTMSKETFALNVDSWTWSRLADFPASARAAPCLCQIDSKCALLYGGAERAEFGLKARSDVWLYRLNGNQWECLLDDDKGLGSPPPRNAATMARTSDKTFLLSGGWEPFRETWDDCYQLRIEE